MFIGLLASISNLSNHTNYISLNNRQCMIHSTLTNLHSNEYRPELPYYPWSVNVDRCMGSCNTLNDLCNTLCVPSKTEDLNRTDFNIITGVNESNTYIEAKHISSKCDCKFGGSQYKSNQKWNRRLYLETWYMYLWEWYVGSIIDDSVITCDIIINATDSASTNVPSKKK